MSVTASKMDLIRELFIRTADENYVAARWCAINRLDQDFLWLAVHALEKYLKAVLLANGRSARFQGHDIRKLHAEVKPLAAGLLPETLEKPLGLEVAHWRERTTKQFVDHLYDNGNAENRYAIYGHVVHSQDLHLLDRLVFAVRRLAHPLDGSPYRQQPGVPTDTWRGMLERNPTFQAWHTSGMPLDRLIADSEPSPLRTAALNENYAFAPEGFAHTPLREGSSAVNPVIVRRVLTPLESETLLYAEEGIAVGEWLLANVALPGSKKGDPGVVGQIADAVAAAKRRHGLG